MHKTKIALNKAGLRRMKEMMDAAFAAAAGEATVRTFSRIANTTDPGNPVVNGGARTIDSVNAMSSATVTAAEVTMLLTIAQFNPGHDLVTDLSGNGGGGQLEGRI